MIVGIIGSGGREHAICHALNKSKKIDKIYCFPGNAGTDAIAENINLDINKFEEIKNSVSKPFFNRAVEGQYAPGSTFKPIVGLGGISFGLMDWDTIIDDKGTFSLPGGDRVYRDWAWTPKNPGGQGKVDLRRAIYRSSNIYFYDVASRMDIGSLASFTEQFGYGKKLILDFPTVVTGLVPDEEWKLRARGEKWYQGDTVNLGIGQGDLLVTPVQVAYLAATIANRGELVDLKMVRSIPISASIDAGEYSRTSSKVSFQDY